MQHHKLDVATAASVRKKFVGPSLSMEPVATAASLLELTAKAQPSHGLKTVKTHWSLKSFLKGETPQAAEAVGCPVSQHRKQEHQLGESTVPHAHIAPAQLGLSLHLSTEELGGTQLQSFNCFLSSRNQYFNEL